MVRSAWRALGLGFAVAALLGAGSTSGAQESPSSLVGKPAPGFTLAQLTLPDQPFGPQDMKGQVWLLNVWASWCSACRLEHPLLLDLAGRGALPIVGLAYLDTRAAGVKWLDKHGNPYRHVILDADGKVGVDYGVSGLPDTFVIDKRGVIRLKLTGPLSADIIAQQLLPLIKALNRS